MCNKILSVVFDEMASLAILKKGLSEDSPEYMEIDKISSRAYALAQWVFEAHSPEVENG